MKGSKEEAVKQAIEEFRCALDSKIKPEELKIYQKRFEKMRINIPDDL